MEIGREMGIYELLGGELLRIARLVEEDNDFRLVIEAPIVGKDVRERVLAAICEAAGFHEMTLRFLKLLNAKGRLPQLRGIAATYQELMDEAQGRVRAGIISAAPLSADAEARIKAALMKITGKEILMTVDVDEGLIGGIITRVAGKLFDGSVKTQLRAVEENLKSSSGGN